MRGKAEASGLSLHRASEGSAVDITHPILWCVGQLTFWFCKTGLQQTLPPLSGTRVCQVKRAAAGYGKIIQYEIKSWCRFGQFTKWLKWLLVSGTREVEESLRSGISHSCELELDLNHELNKTYLTHNTGYRLTLQDLRNQMRPLMIDQRL